MFTSVLPHKWRPYYKGRISNSSLYSWGDLIPQCISELLCLPSLFECYQDCKHTVAGKQKHMSPSCVVIIVEKIPELLFWILLMGWSTIYLNVDGGRSLQMNKQIWIHSCVLKNYDWEPSIILPIEWIIWFVDAQDQYELQRLPLHSRVWYFRKLFDGLWISNSVPILAKV